MNKNANSERLDDLLKVKGVDLCIPVTLLQISSYFTDKLLGIVRDAIFHMKDMKRSENDQPILQQFTDKTHKGDAALEFIKHVCAVLALDQNVQHDVLVILVLIRHCIV